MKKIFVLIAVCFVSCCCFCQSYDVLRDYKSYDKFTTRDVNTYTFNKCHYDYAYKERYIFGKKDTEVDWANTKITVIKNGGVVPRYIWDDYEFACGLYKGGVGTIITGVFLSTIGGCVYGLGARDGNAKNMGVGTAFLAVGGTFISVSIPLLCFGYNMKRNVNRDFKMYKHLTK